MSISGVLTYHSVQIHIFRIRFTYNIVSNPVIGCLIAIFANPTSKKQGRKAVQQNDVFITPLSTVNTGFSGADTYQPFGSTQNSTAGYDTSYGTQNAFDTQNVYGTQNSYDQQSGDGAQGSYGDQNLQSAQNVNNDWVDVYGQHSDNNNNSTGF